jgi:P27 family predicted phage terminase small subunit
MAGNSRSGRKPLPTQLKLITGNPGRRPLNENEPKPRVALLRPPAELNDEGRIEWRRVARELYTLGILTTVDRAALFAYCQSYGRLMRAEREFAAAGGNLLVRSKRDTAFLNPLISVANLHMANTIRYASEFGMTPSARSRIKTEGPIDRADPAAKYLNNR